MCITRLFLRYVLDIHGKPKICLVPGVEGNRMSSRPHFFATKYMLGSLLVFIPSMCSEKLLLLSALGPRNFFYVWLMATGFTYEYVLAGQSQPRMLDP